MSNDYLPPESTNLPFNFTNQGYVPSGSTSLLFNFISQGNIGTLRAAVNVMTPYWYTTHTYAKSCPRYVVGYGSSGIQIIKGRCLFGGIRDLQGIISGLSVDSTRLDLLSQIYPISKKGISYLLATIRLTVLEFPENLQSIIRGWQRDNFNVEIGVHNAINLRATTKGIVKVYTPLAAYIRSWQKSDLGMVLSGSHDPVDLSGKLRVLQRRYTLLPVFIYAWHARDVTASLNIVFPYDLQSTIDLIPPSNLSGYLKVRLQTSLQSRIRGWQDYSLNAVIQQIWAMSLSAIIYGGTDTKKNLLAKIKGCGSEYKDLHSSITSFHWESLGAILRSTYLSDVHAYIYAVVPKNISARIHVWHERFLQGILNAQNYPWNLTAQIDPKGNWSTFAANIQPRKNRETCSDLMMIIHPWDTKLLSAYIMGSGAPVLSAYLNPLGYAHDLHGYIRPKIIRLTTIINIPTQLHNNISATINYPCFRTGYSFLPSYIYTKYKGDLYAYIKPICYNYKPKSLSAKVGYTDAYLEVDKLKLSISIYPSEFFTEDKFKLLLHLLDAENMLSAYIKGTLRYNSISARITCDAIPSYTFGAILQNREIVVHKTYDGIFKTFEVVEMAFKTAVKDYFFSSAGEFAWKSDRFDKWVFDIKSILPPSTPLGTIRRLHKATTVYDLKKFKSIDEAIRAAISYVTEYPQSTLGASIVNLGTYIMLNSMINPKYTITSKISLESTIIPVGNTVFVNEKNTITKI
jgi:hypothetical protein